VFKTFERRKLQISITCSLCLSSTVFLNLVSFNKFIDLNVVDNKEKIRKIPS